MATVLQLFNKFDITEFQCVKWGTTFAEKKQGIYVVSTSSDPLQHLGLSARPDFDDQQIDFWINSLSDFKVDGRRAVMDNVKGRLSHFWLPDESILYIGKAPTRKNGSGISKRVIEYYSTIIGKRRPHAGGQWIKVLKNIDRLTVYYGACDKPGEIELKMLGFFMKNVSEITLERLHDKKLPLPFANIKFTGNKNHGLGKQRK